MGVNAALASLVTSCLLAAPPRADAYAWDHAPAMRTLADLAAPEGTTRDTHVAGSMGAWMRGVPLKPGRPDVLLHDGRKKRNQDGHVAVVDMDTGRADLQQCADTVIRFHAEWLWGTGRAEDACFHFTSGHAIPWTRHARGERAVVKGNRVTWSAGGKADASRGAYRAWLQGLFMYAGTLSLARETVKVRRVADVLAGDVFVEGGSPGHAVLVADVAREADGTPLVMLVQGYMPAQEPHVVSRVGDVDASWHRLVDGEELRLPDWTFAPGTLRRFPPRVCAER